MHEWALAEAVVSTVLEIAEKERLKDISEVILKFGELQQVDKEIFRFALSQLKPELLKKTKFTFNSEKATLRCRACNHQWSFQDEKLEEDVSEAIHFLPEVAHSYVKCPKCRSPDFDILTGRGVWLDSVRGVKE